MAGLMLAAAISVALANTVPTIAQDTYQSVVTKTYVREKKEAIDKKASTKAALNQQSIIRITKLDPLTVHTILAECQKNSMDTFLILGLLKTESRFIPTATSRTGARGLGQLTTPVGRLTAKREGIEFTSRSLYNPSINAKLTVNYFSYLLKSYKGNVHRTLTAYNRGEGGLRSFEQRNHTPVSSFSQKVLKNAKEMHQLYDKLQEEKVLKKPGN